MDEEEEEIDNTLMDVVLEEVRTCHACQSPLSNVLAPDPACA